MSHLPVGPVHHLRQAVADLQRSKAFYTEVLGFAVAMDTPPPPEDEHHDALVDSLQGGVILMHEGMLVGLRPVDDERASAGVALMFGVVLGGAAAIGVALDWTEPYWVPEPILVLVLYLIVGKRDRIQGKAIGTAVGAIAALPVALLDPPAGVLAAVGTVGIVVAFALVKTYWRMYALYTFSLVLLLAAPNQVGYEADERGVQILAGIGLLVVGFFILHAVGRWLEDHHPQPELVEPAA